MSLPPRILVIEDNADLARGIAYNLRLEGYDVRIAGDGRAGLTEAVAWEPHLVLLDLMLPKLDGYEVLRSVRERAIRVPVIILSARAEEADKVRGFKLDADMYVTKPFGVLELLERVAALLRRAGLDRPWFAGGTVDWVSVRHDGHRLRAGIDASEDGTANYYGIAALAPGFAFLRHVGLRRLGAHTSELTRRLLRGLGTAVHRGGAPAVRVYGPADLLL